MAIRKLANLKVHMLASCFRRLGTAIGSVGATRLQALADPRAPSDSESGRRVHGWDCK